MSPNSLVSARGFRLEALLKMKEMKTAKGNADCPTLLHYIARILMRRDPKLIMFINEIRNVGPAARVSFQTVSQSVKSIITSFGKAEAEVQFFLKQDEPPSTNDRFVEVMQPFLVRISGQVHALKDLTASVENDLRSLFIYYGESFDSPEGPKPDEFFGMICSFSSSLQKAAEEVGNATARPALDTRRLAEESKMTVMNAEKPMSDLLVVPSKGHERQRSCDPGDVDEAIRILRNGYIKPKRDLPSPLRASRIFLDGRPEA
ncbi:hypothetical protein F5I97DRAFT_1925836 [Phlebopus sp. FC_14]|nr:hypothetical protein F5I97DRAFT_1925836 [Phlebopus sp. FC_14]